MLTPRLRPLGAALGAAACLAACGSSAPASSNSSAAATSSPSARPTASATPAQRNAALQVALTAAELDSVLSGFTQTSDGLLGNTPSTDARVFSSADGTTKVEVDLAADTSIAAASSDYSAYSTAAQKQVTSPQSSKAPSIGTKANETVGTDANGHSVVSISFVQGTVIGVVTMVSTATTVDPALAERLANLQVSKVTAANL